MRVLKWLEAARVTEELPKPAMGRGRMHGVGALEDGKGIPRGVDGDPGGIGVLRGADSLAPPWGQEAKDGLQILILSRWKLVSEAERQADVPEAQPRLGCRSADGGDGDARGSFDRIVKGELEHDGLEVLELDGGDAAKRE